MTSGSFHIVPLHSIIVKRDERQRRDLENIDVLADSIRRLGLIHPIVVTRDDLTLVAGERRLAACTLLGWTSIPAQYQDELDMATLEAIELEENIKRIDISWYDQVNAISRYHDLRAEQSPEWRQKDTAAALGMTQQWIARMIQVKEEMNRGNQLVINAPKLSTAVGIMERARERRSEAAMQDFRSTVDGAKLDMPETILAADFTEWALGDHPWRFNLIHCDFPYGIEADSFNHVSAAAHGGYADTPETWRRLMDALEITTKRLTAPSCHLMFWFAMRKGDERLYEPTANALERIGWNINPQPLIWMKSDGSGILPDPERGPRQIYETCFLGTRGDRKIIRAVANAYAAPLTSGRHMSEKPEPMLHHFFRMLVDESTVFLDPTCGSGSALRAAESLGCKNCLGLEINTEFANIARRELTRARSLRKASTTVS